MFQAKEKLLDRVEQSFILLKDNFLSLSLPFIIFNVITLVIIPSIVTHLIFGNISLEGVTSGQSASILIASLFAGGILAFIAYLIILIPFQISIIKGIKQALAGNTITFKENLSYGFSNLGKIFRTYWYIFSYVYLIPALTFIAGGFIMLGGLLTRGASNGDIFDIMSITLIIVSIVMMLFFGVYRGLKSSFAIVSAIDTEEFTKENFLSSLSVTKQKWWRIAGNILGVSFLGGLAIGFIGGIGDAFVPSSFDTDSIGQMVGSNANISKEDITELLNGFTQFNPIAFINNIFQNALGTILGIFISIFIYVFFKRLELENGKVIVSEKEVIEGKTIEL